MSKLVPSNFFLISILTLAIASTIFLFNRYRTLGNHNTRLEVLRHEYSQHRLKITGFRFNGFKNGENSLFIKADKFTIEKKKLGYFRLGLIYVARFENPVVEVYLKRKKDGNEGRKDDNDMDFMSEALLPLRDAFPSFANKRISAIILEHVCLKLQGEGSLLTRFTSNSAIIRLQKRDILFKGGVRVVSGDKILTTERLKVLAENFLMKSEGHFVLDVHGKKIDGDLLTVDFLLNVVKDKPIGKPFDSSEFHH